MMANLLFVSMLSLVPIRVKSLSITLKEAKAAGTKQPIGKIPRRAR